MTERRRGRVEIIDPHVLRHLANHPARGARYTVRELAEVTGAKPSAMGHWLSGARHTLPSDVAYSFSEAVGVPPQCLFTPWLTGTVTTTPEERP